MIPNFRIKTAEKDLTEAIQSRLISLTIKDEAGLKSDRMTLMLADEPAIQWPKDDQVFTVAIGYEDRLIDVGSYAVQHIAVSGPPRILKIEATALQQSKSLKSQREESWDSVTFGSIVGEIARRNGLKAAVALDLQNILIDHEDQTESDIAFLTRLGRRNDAVIKISSSNLIAVRTGKAKTASGKDLPPVKVSNPISYEYSGDQTKGYTGVRAYWYDANSAQKRTVLVGKEGVVLELTFNKATEDGARKAAETKFREVARKGKTLALTVSGNPELSAERKCLVSGIREGLNGEWVIKSVEHSIDGSGYFSKVECDVDGYKEASPADIEDEESGTER